MPAPPKLQIEFQHAEEREQLVQQLGVMVDRKFKKQAWATWYPPRGRNDPSALYFDVEQEMPRTHVGVQAPAA